MPDFTCLDENLFAKVAQTLLQHISSTHCNFKSVLGPSILLLCVRLADVQMNGFIGTSRQDVFIPLQSLTLDCSRGSCLRDCGREHDQSLT